MIDRLRLALRALAHTPGFSVVAVLALALAIGANSAIYSLVQAIFLQPLPYRDAGRLVQLSSSIPERNLNQVGFSWPRLQAVRDAQQVFSQIEVAAPTGFTLTGVPEAEQLGGMQVSAGYFELLGVSPQLGRSFRTAEDQPGGERVVVISHPFWQRHFGARSDALGKTLQLDGQPYTVIGVLPESVSRFPLQQVDVFSARPTEVSYLVREQIDGGGFFFNVIARLRPDSDIQAAQRQMEVIASGYAQANPALVDAPASIDVRPLLTALVGDQQQTYTLLFAAVGCVLLIACANVANLVLSRHAGRRKQVAIRFALGARRRDVLVELMLEHWLLAVLAGLIGLALAWAGLRLVVAGWANFIPRAEELQLDLGVLGFTLLVSLATGALLGLICASQVGSAQLTDALRDSTRSATGSRRQQRLRKSLMVAEVAGSFMLLVAAALLIGSFVRLQNVSPGFNSHGVYAGLVQVPSTKYPVMSEELAGFYGRLEARLAQIPGVSAAALHSGPPLSGFAGASPFAVVGQAIPSPREQPLAQRNLVGPGAFELLQIPLLAGRYFNDRDTPGSTPVVIINQAMAEQAFGNEDPIGRRIVSGMLQLEQEVVGVIANAHTQDLATAPVAEMYYPILQRPEGFAVALLRTEGDPARLAASVRAALADVDPTVPLVNSTTLEQMMADSMADRRLLMALTGGFAVLALVLASLGVYSVMAYSVTQRKAEIGLRMAIGANAGNVQQMVVRQGMSLSGLGLLIGLAGALLLTRLMQNLLFGIGNDDPLTYLGIAALLAAVSALATWLPARRAARVDPLIALRDE